MKMWESAKHQSWRIQVEGFKGHVATDGSLCGLIRLMKTNFEEDQRHLINWNQSTTKTCRRRHEWQETFFTSVVRTV